MSSCRRGRSNKSPRQWSKNISRMWLRDKVRDRVLILVKVVRIVKRIVIVLLRLTLKLRILLLRRIVRNIEEKQRRDKDHLRRE